MAAAASKQGTARGTMQGSWRPWITKVVFSPRDREDAGRAAVARANELLAREVAPELPLGDGAVASFLNKVAAGVSALAQGNKNQTSLYQL